jgi:hypothetical protein
MPGSRKKEPGMLRAFQFPVVGQFSFQTAAEKGQKPLAYARGSE